MNGEEADFTLNSFVSHHERANSPQETVSGNTVQVVVEPRLDWKNFSFLCNRDISKANAATTAKGCNRPLKKEAPIKMRDMRFMNEALALPLEEYELNGVK